MLRGKRPITDYNTPNYAAVATFHAPTELILNAQEGSLYCLA